MCFSASASFGASAVLATVGVVTLRKVKDARQIPFAAIPLMFAAQQVSEGLVWIGLANPEHAAWSRFPVYIFLVFAQVIWPFWIPFAVFKMEKDSVRKRFLAAFLVVGLIFSSYILYCLFAFDVSAEISVGHIHYSLDFPYAFTWISSVLYAIPTVVSLFVSSVKRLYTLGVCIALSYLVARWFFLGFVISVWCFFAAILSFIILWIVTGLNEDAKTQDARLG
ncbi:MULTISPECIES: DUF6629 family protein [unclassified Imperialibacter]|uniref:DUF6629 family protein n=1 Tax=unclassified Imperialibacter TaxID=2629706 RepID=UPI00125C62D5|nr:MULTISPECIES: DUF6629 family protein [unclassified Imperialibacter]CAD5265323.1 conserved membrane hypothetical protein [Imperialibacter sp. 89]CAD5270193.1 conserved membrane hypothetical protein [Imperialibacter sp. 75]VVT09813.1 conserved membrane hypothetical protein [Imperialibacter sp. EC-SDR9]